jgi:hypothetical protein
MNLADHIYKEGDRYYFDTELYEDNNALKLSLEYEHGDKIIWKSEGKKYSGILRSYAADNSLFLIDRVTIVE